MLKVAVDEPGGAVAHLLRVALRKNHCIGDTQPDVQEVTAHAHMLREDLARRMGDLLSFLEERAENGVWQVLAKRIEGGRLDLIVAGNRCERGSELPGHIRFAARRVVALLAGRVKLVVVTDKREVSFLGHLLFAPYTV